MDDAKGDAVGAEKQVDVGGHARGVAVRAPETGEALLDALHQGVEVGGMIEEIPHHVHPGARAGGDWRCHAFRRPPVVVAEYWG